MKKEAPTEGDLIEYIRMSLALCGVAIDSRTAYLLKNIFEEIKKKGGDFNIHDAVRIKYNVDKKYERLEIKAVTNTEPAAQESDTTKMSDE